METDQICGKLVSFVEDCSDFWKTGQIYEKLIRFVKKLIRFVEDLLDLWKLVRFVDH